MEQESTSRIDMEIVKSDPVKEGEANMGDKTGNAMNVKQEHSVEHFSNHTGRVLSILGHGDGSILLDLKDQISRIGEFPLT
jgi:hypothetical protein